MRFQFGWMATVAALAVSFLAPGATRGSAGGQVLRLSLAPGWNLVALPFTWGTLPANWVGADTHVWTVSNGETAAKPAFAHSPHPNDSDVARGLGRGVYWCSSIAVPAHLMPQPNGFY